MAYVNQPFETVREDWNEYRLANGVIVRVKTVLAVIALNVGEDGEVLTLQNGQPEVQIGHQIVVSAIAPAKPEPATEPEHVVAPHRLH